MKRIFFFLTILSSLCADAQIVNRFRDSTNFYGSVRMDSIVRITKGAAAGRVLTSDANGTATWQNPASDSIVFNNGLTRSGDTVKLGGTLDSNTIITFSPSNNYIVFGNIDSGTAFYYGNLLGDGGRFGSAGNSAINLTVDLNNGRFAGLGALEDDGTGNASSGLNVIQDGYDYGLYNFYNGGKRTANIYFGLHDGNGTTDISRLEANINEVHGRHIIDSTATIPNYNGFHANRYYSQLEYDKQAEDDQATGTLWVLDANGASYYVGGSFIFRIGNTIPTYADDAAAAAGGVAVNQVYKTTTGGSTFLKIRQ